MAGTPVPEETPKLGWKATVAGFVFAAAVLTGFGVATAVSYEDSSADKAGYDKDASHSEDADHSDESE